MAMVNMLLGPPGGGKSYEAVVYHILPALEAGRLVITNLPLNMDHIAAVNPEWVHLIKRVSDRIGMVSQVVMARAGAFRPRVALAGQTEGLVRAFSTMADFGDSWRHPVSGAGPLYVIDECHLCFPVKGTVLAVEEWFSMIRHETADALLLSQSVGKVSKAITDLVQVCYLVRKATAFGSDTKYIRKVRDGVRGDVVNTAIRTYDARWFPFYQSHTKGGGTELGAGDIVPFWRRVPVMLAGLFLVGGAVAFFTSSAGSFLGGGAGAAPSKGGHAPSNALAVASPVASPVASSVDAAVAAVPGGKSKAHPFAGRGLHAVGSVVSSSRALYLFVVSQNGQAVMTVDNAELERLGYSVSPVGPCAVKLGFGDWSQWVICDAPQVGVVVAAAPPLGGGG